MVAPPQGAVAVKPPAVPSGIREEQPRPAEKPVIAVKPPSAPTTVAPAAVAPAPPAAVMPPTPPAAVETFAAASEIEAATITAQAVSAAPAAAAHGAVSEPRIAAESVAQASRPATEPVLPPARRMVMPQTGPRPVYKATVMPAAPLAPATGIQRGKPIFDRRPASGPGGFTATPALGPAVLPDNSRADQGPSIPLAPRLADLRQVGPRWSSRRAARFWRAPWIWRAAPRFWRTATAWSRWRTAA